MSGASSALCRISGSAQKSASSPVHSPSSLQHWIVSTTPAAFVSCWKLWGALCQFRSHANLSSQHEDLAANIGAFGITPVAVAEGREELSAVARDNGGMEEWRIGGDLSCTQIAEGIPAG